ncbi:AI-2E family transporter [Larsenimonas rhizosphaerae]|uniref:AI-2E family transporter n=1 Tax=Larsenimonas rhizosphaerae TaxID=2944682 RepID=A0AA41ZMI1_9GAMM|nr:AI-2E family transporter [Larsenimonas rhizosphaerae]MCM2131990.1 AI-2E family transporter [Larsenimonas rhizosphaerae]MCX2524593.1 AI-2E family transporter [Larsenimonas rhizosphaerae]
MEDREHSERHYPYHLVVTLASLVIIITGLKVGADLVVPVLLSVFIAVLCSRPVSWLHGKGLPVTPSVCLVLACLAILMAAFGTLIASHLNAFIDQLPDMEVKLKSYYGSTLDWLAGVGLPVSRHSAENFFDPDKITGLMPMLLGGVGSALSQTLIVFLLIVFVLYETLDFPKKLELALDQPEASMRRFTQFSLTLQRYLVVKTVISLVTGLLVSLACVLLGVQFAFLWGVMAFLLNYIPNIGSILAAIPAVLLTLVMPEGGVIKAAMLGGAYACINFILGNFVEPRVMGQTLGMSTLVAFLSLVVWGWILGPVGMFLSVPLTMSLKIALDSHPDTRWLSVMIGPTRRRRKKIREAQTE